MKTLVRVILQISVAVSVVAAAPVMAAEMSPPRKAIYEHYEAAAKSADPSFAGFSAERGKKFFHGTHTGGKPDINSCTTCHTKDLTQSGRTRAGKLIKPMAASVNPMRFISPADVEKWFTRNCSTVLGRECTVVEKGDVLAYLLSL
ncbi:MAG: DUF1924 domain-containing protein [Alphaproteobacteria bacterium]